MNQDTYSNVERRKRSPRVHPIYQSSQQGEERAGRATSKYHPMAPKRRLLMSTLHRSNQKENWLSKTNTARTQELN